MISRKRPDNYCFLKWLFKQWSIVSMISRKRPDNYCLKKILFAFSFMHLHDVTSCTVKNGAKLKHLYCICTTASSNLSWYCKALGPYFQEFDSKKMFFWDSCLLQMKKFSLEYTVPKAISRLEIFHNTPWKCPRYSFKNV